MRGLSFGSKSSAAPFRKLVEELLREDPSLPSGVILERVCAAGYKGGRTAVYSLVDRCRPATSGLPPASEPVASPPVAEPAIGVAQQLAELRRMIGNLSRPPEPGAAALPAPSLPPITIREIFVAYEERRHADHSWNVIRDRLRPLVRRLGDLPAMALTPRALAEHVAKRRLEPLITRAGGGAGSLTGRRGRFPSQGTITIEISRVKTMFRWASHPDQGLIPSNPIASVRVQKHRHRETALTEADLLKVLEVATPTLRAFVLICIDSGLRLNEARQLRRDWIRPNGVVSIPWEITKSKKTRLVVLTPRAIEAIGAMPEETLQHPEIFRNPSTGRLYGEGTFWRAFREACEAAGIDQRAAAGDERIHIHDLRHTAASAAIRRGAPITAVQQMLGHANLSTTSIYLHADESDAINLARLMHEGADRERQKEAV